MRRAGWRQRADDAYFARAILEARSTLHVSYRLAVRTVQLVSVAGAASVGTGMWRGSLPAFALADVLTWLILRRSRRFFLGWRVLVDAVDISFWSLSPRPVSHFYDTAVVIGVPLAVEAGFRMGGFALVVPLVEASVVGPVRALAGRSAHPFTFAWLLLGIGLGIALFSYCRRLYLEAESERGRQRAADARRAFLAGQNAVAMGASSVVDSIEGLVPILGRPETGSALWHLADGWKARLGASTAQSATYLQVCLLEWERCHNRHPDLSSDVELQLEEGTGTTLLTPGQVRAIHRSLEGLDLHGPVAVTVPGDPRARPIGASLSLQVGAHRVLVPADAHAVYRPVDPAPVTYVLIAAEVPTMAFPNAFHVPRVWVVVGMALCLVAGWWSDRWLRSHGPGGREGIVWSAIAVALLLTLILGGTARRAVAIDGDTSYTGIGLLLFAVLVGMYSYGLRRRVALAVAVTSVVIVVLAVAFNDSGFSFWSLLTMLVAELAPYPTCRRISISLGHAAERYAAVTRADDEGATRAAFRRGLEDVITLVRQARDDAYSQLARVAPSIPPRLAAVATTRLEEVDRRLIAISGDGELSSSTTTS